MDPLACLSLVVKLEVYRLPFSNNGSELVLDILMQSQLAIMPLNHESVLTRMFTSMP